MIFSDMVLRATNDHAPKSGMPLIGVVGDDPKLRGAGSSTVGLGAGRLPPGDTKRLDSRGLPRRRGLLSPYSANRTFGAGDFGVLGERSCKQGDGKRYEWAHCQCRAGRMDLALNDCPYRVIRYPRRFLGNVFCYPLQRELN